MRKIGKIERINNILFATVLFALALFMFVYEYAAIGAYAGTLEQEERAGFAVAMIIVYIFYYVFGGFCLIVDAVCTFAFTMSLKNVLLNNGESKRRIVIIVLKAVACVLIGYFAGVTFDTAHATILSKIVYCVAAVCCVASVVYSIYSLCVCKAEKQKEQEEITLQEGDK